jgi:hypothetical protein
MYKESLKEEAMITRENLQKCKNAYKEMSQKIFDIVAKMYLIENDKEFKGEIHTVDFNDGMVEVGVVEYFLGCGDEFDDYEFPEEYLHSEWEEDYKEKLRIAKEKEAKMKEIEKRLIAEMRERKDREKYEELKKRFEPVDPL